MQLCAYLQGHAIFIAKVARCLNWNSNAESIWLNTQMTKAVTDKKNHQY